ncbi:hypothetical protein AB0C34_18910 [Nocardia sp. NPDC049220]|uniref:hypothetical protein n=1 Tax=Nocardia sp. NPDC049220 TaxID=3155273 RepID=UPI0033E82EFE
MNSHVGAEDDNGGPWIRPTIEHESSRLTPPDGRLDRDLVAPNSFGRHGDVLHAGNVPESGTPLYRGVARLLPDGTVNPAYRQAVSGVAAPRGAADLSAEDHITQVRARHSDSTSWTRDRTTAAVFTNGDGVILEWRTGLPPDGALWRFKPTWDIDGDLSQVLVQGTLTDARAVRHLA